MRCEIWDYDFHIFLFKLFFDNIKIHNMAMLLYVRSCGIFEYLDHFEPMYFQQVNFRPFVEVSLIFNFSIVCLCLQKLPKLFFVSIFLWTIRATVLIDMPTTSISTEIASTSSFPSLIANLLLQQVQYHLQGTVSYSDNKFDNLLHLHILSFWSFWL